MLDTENKGFVNNKLSKMVPENADKLTATTTTKIQDADRKSKAEAEGENKHESGKDKTKDSEPRRSLVSAGSRRSLVSVGITPALVSVGMTPVVSGTLEPVLHSLGGAPDGTGRGLVAGGGGGREFVAGRRSSKVRTSAAGRASDLRQGAAGPDHIFAIELSQVRLLIRGRREHFAWLVCELAIGT
jgi:hypothetical protein